jgi:hypothetical protein
MNLYERLLFLQQFFKGQRSLPTLCLWLSIVCKCGAVQQSKVNREMIMDIAFNIYMPSSSLGGGFKHEFYFPIFSISFMGCHPSH